MEVLGEILQGTYRIERLIGQGGMGAVYEASHVRLARRFAIKVLAHHLADFPEAVARFRQEAEVASSLGHPHILQVIDFNYMASGQPYLIMDLLEGENLCQRLQRQRPLGLGPAISICEQTASALQAVHQRGIVHRDLKPANIFLCRDGRADTFVRVLDFGISKVLGSKSGMTKENAILGSPHYMSPEQASGESALVDARCDIYSLGVIVFELIAGRPPFDDPALGGLLEKIINDPPPTLRSHGIEVGVELDDVIGRALEKSPDARWPSMDAFWSAISEAVHPGKGGREPGAVPRWRVDTEVTRLLEPTSNAVSTTLLETTPLTVPERRRLHRTATGADLRPAPDEVRTALPHSRRWLLLSLALATMTGGLVVSWTLFSGRARTTAAADQGGEPQRVLGQSGREDRAVTTARRDGGLLDRAASGAAPEPDRLSPSRPDAGPGKPASKLRPRRTKTETRVRRPSRKEVQPPRKDWIIEPELD